MEKPYPTMYPSDDNNWQMLAELDLEEPYYSFDLLVVWRNIITGEVVYATDSGCSCPSPFENHEADDYKEFSWSAIDAVIAEHRADEYASGPKPDDVLEFKNRLRTEGV